METEQPLCGGKLNRRQLAWKSIHPEKCCFCFREHVKPGQKVDQDSWLLKEMFSFLFITIYFLTDNPRKKECGAGWCKHSSALLWGRNSSLLWAKLEFKLAYFWLSSSVVGNSFFIPVLLIKSAHCYLLHSDEGLDWCCDVMFAKFVTFF